MGSVFTIVTSAAESGASSTEALDGSSCTLLEAGIRTARRLSIFTPLFWSSATDSPASHSCVTASLKSTVSLAARSEEHTSELQSLRHLVCRLLLGSEEHTSELQSLRH